MNIEITEQKNLLEEPPGKTYKSECLWCGHVVDYLDKYSLPHTINGDPINCKEFVLGIKQCTFDPKMAQFYNA